MWLAKFAMRTALVIVLLSYVLPYAMKLGGRWESQHNPTEGVKVVMEDDRVITGILTRDWDGSYILTAKDGVHRFNGFKMMSVPRQEQNDAMPWRMMLPIFLTLGLFAGGGMVMERYLIRRAKQSDK